MFTFLRNRRAARAAGLVAQWKSLDRVGQRHLKRCQCCRPGDWCAEMETLDEQARALWARMSDTERDQC